MGVKDLRQAQGTLLVEHVEDLIDRMATLWPLVREHIQEAQAWVYNRGAQRRDFQPEDKVLFPYEVIENEGEVNYRVR